MRRAGFRSVFIVDDNFIGNKKKAKALLEKLILWMEQHHYPLHLTTEAGGIVRLCCGRAGLLPAPQAIGPR